MKAFNKKTAIIIISLFAAAALCIGAVLVTASANNFSYRLAQQGKAASSEIIIVSEIEQPPVYNIDDVLAVTLMQSQATFTLSAESPSPSASQLLPIKYTLITENATQEVDLALAAEFLSRINGIRFKACEASAPQALEAYGLQAPSATISVTYALKTADNFFAPQSYTLLIGGGAPDGSRYIMLDGTNTVCLTGADDISAILSSAWEE